MLISKEVSAYRSFFVCHEVHLFWHIITINRTLLQRCIYCIKIRIIHIIHLKTYIFCLKSKIMLHLQ